MAKNDHDPQLSAAALFRYWSYRYRLDHDELVVRQGVLFRNERHIPYARVQNIDLVQNPLHRLFGVAEVRLAVLDEGVHVAEGDVVRGSADPGEEELEVVGVVSVGTGVGAPAAQPFAEP